LEKRTRGPSGGAKKEGSDQVVLEGENLKGGRELQGEAKKNRDKHIEEKTGTEMCGMCQTSSKTSGALRVHATLSNFSPYRKR